MTLCRALLIGALLMGVVVPASAGQHARRAAPPADGPSRSSDDRTARPSNAEPRSAEPRHSREEHSREDARRSGPVTVAPVVALPALVGGFTVGKPVVVGAPFVVGGAPRSAVAEPFYRYQSRDYARTGVAGVIVPGYVPVAVGLPVVEDVFLRSASSVRNDESAYFSFRPWYPVGNALMAGVPVFLPAPSTFDEGNTSPSVSEDESDPGSDRAVTAPRTYANEIGGISFSIKPVDAAVYVDGRFVGSASDYSPTREPLLLRFGSYAVELRAQGHVTERFTVSVAMGEVMPFSGGLVKGD